MDRCKLCGADLAGAATCPRCGEPVGPGQTATPAPPLGPGVHRESDIPAPPPATAAGTRPPSAPTPADRVPPTGPTSAPTRTKGYPVAVLLVVIVMLVLGLGALVVSRGSDGSSDASDAMTDPPSPGDPGSDESSLTVATADEPSAPATTTTTSTPTPVELISGSIIARASSELPPVTSRGLTYDAGNLLDGDPTTAWSQAGSQGDQPTVGSWVAFDLPQPTDVTMVGIINGYVKSDKAYTENARPRSIVISSDDGTEVRVTLEDIRTQQEIAVDLPGASTITITIESVYPGSKYPDVAMTEVRFTGLVAD